MIKKIAVIDTNGRSSASGSLLEYIERFLEGKGVKVDVLGNPSKLTGDYTHIVFISGGMCEIAEEIKKENPEKIVILLTGGMSKRSCLDHVIPIQTGSTKAMNKLYALIG